MTYNSKCIAKGNTCKHLDSPLLSPLLASAFPGPRESRSRIGEPSTIKQGLFRDYALKFKLEIQVPRQSTGPPLVPAISHFNPDLCLVPCLVYSVGANVLGGEHLIGYH